MNEAKIAWVAGFYEGEGTACLAGEYKSTRVYIFNTDKETLDQVQSFLGFGSVKSRNSGPRKEEWKECFEWVVYSQEEVKLFFELIWPWISKRRKDQAQPLLDFIAYREKAREEGRPKINCFRPSSARARKHRLRGERPCRACADVEKSYYHKRKNQTPWEVS